MSDGFKQAHIDLTEAGIEGNIPQMEDIIWKHFTYSYAETCADSQVTPDRLQIKINEINAIGGYYGTILHAVCAAGRENQEAAVNLLLTVGADPGKAVPSPYIYAYAELAALQHGESSIAREIARRAWNGPPNDGGPVYFSKTSYVAWDDLIDKSVKHVY